MRLSLPAALLLIILLSLAISYGMNVWNRAIFDALEKRRRRDRASGFDALFSAAGGERLLVAIAQVYARMTMQRRWRAWLSNHLLDRWLQRRPLLPTQSDQRRPPESGISHRRRCAGGDRSAGRLRHRRTDRRPVGDHVHRRAVDDRRRADRRDRRQQRHHSGLSRDRGRALRRDRQRLDGAHRPPLRRRVGRQESVGSGVPLRAHAAARERRKHRGARRRRRRSAAASTSALTKVLRSWRDICVQTMRTTIVSQTSGYVSRRSCPSSCARRNFSRLDDPWRGHAGGIRLHDRAGRVQLAGRQLSAACRLDRVGASRVATLMVSLDGLERRRSSARLRPDRARRTPGRSAAAARSLGDAR